jgi:hypothetical protein
MIASRKSCRASDGDNELLRHTGLQRDNGEARLAVAIFGAKREIGPLGKPDGCDFYSSHFSFRRPQSLSLRD